MTKFDDDNMEPSEHPADQLIQDYLKAPDAAAFAGLRLHLASCRHCRRRTEMTAMLRDHGHWLESEITETDPRVADLVAGRLDAGQTSRLRQEIKNDPAALRAALHFASHAQAMHEITADKKRGQSPWSMSLALLKRWLSFEAPLWQMAPALAVVMTVAVLVFNQIDSRQSGRRIEIVTFQDNAVLQFAGHESQPGIGFFSQQGANAEPFDGMTIELLENDRLRLSWPEIPGASDYNLKLQVFRDGETHVLTRQTLGSTVVELQLEEPLTQHRYEWILSGDTSDNRSFQTNGGFVITRKQAQ